MEAIDRLIKAFEKFNNELKAFAQDTGEEYAFLYEDINTTRPVKDFKLYKNGNLHYKELTWNWQDGTYTTAMNQIDEHFDEDDINDSLKYWRAALRRAKRYWATEAETLDKMADGEIEDIED